MPKKNTTISTTTIVKHLKLALMAHDILAKEPHQFSAKLVYLPSLEVVSSAINRTTESKSRIALIDALRKAETAYRAKHPGTAVPYDALSELCFRTNEDGSMTKFKDELWWEPHKLPTDQPPLR
jgi:hypothetical protein